MAVAALGTWYVASGADRGPDTHYLVAARAIGPGERLSASDLRQVDLELPDGLAGAAFSHPDEVADFVTLGPIASGELIQAGAIAAAGPTDVSELSFSIESEWAVGGDLRVGDLIDVFDTDDRAGPDGTRRVLTGTTIIDIARPDDGLGRNRTVTITVGVDDPDLLPQAVQATRTGTISVVRVTGAAPDDREAPEETESAGRQESTEDGDETADGGEP